jgi:hypothetical protein
LTNNCLGVVLFLPVLPFRRQALKIVHLLASSLLRFEWVRLTPDDLEGILEGPISTVGILQGDNDRREDFLRSTQP